MNERLRVTQIDDLEALGQRSAEWNALVQRSSTNTVFQTLEWQQSWWKAFGAGARLLLLVVEAGDKLAGIAPLMVLERRVLGRRRRIVEFIGTHAADYCDFIVEPGRPDAVAALVQALLERSGEWDVLHLVNIAETSPLRDALPAAFERRRYTTDLRVLYECPTHVFGDRAADEKLLKKKNIRLKVNRLTRQGRLDFAVYSEAGEIERQLEAFFQQHIERWALTRTPSFFSDERQRTFYRELVRRLAPKAWIVFSVVLFNDRPIAMHFGYEYDKRLYSIKSTFSPQYERYSPGLLEIKYLVEYCLARGLAELDFTGGEESYKYRFTNRMRQNYLVRIYPPWMFYGMDRVLARTKAALQRAPRLRSFGRRLLERWLGEGQKLVGP